MKSNILLLITAIIWGFAFVAQRAGMEYLGPFLFNAIRFVLGSASLIPLLIYNKKRKFKKEKLLAFNNKHYVYGSIIMGIVLFIASAFQQMGIVYTDAGKAGFITGLYIILVPIFGLFVGQSTSKVTWIGAVVAIAGLYFLSVTENFTIDIGDFLVLISAIFWAAQILIVGFLSVRVDSIQLAFTQFLICSLLSFIAALFTEIINLTDIIDATIPILYAGLCSVGIAYTLQIVAQKTAHPANAAIIMSLESVFAVIGGWLVLSESIPLRGLFGCGLMLLGMIISQLPIKSVQIKKE
ncbi:DMT family transporter [bacterium BMS3Abin03]|nr:DMT family transporter [bacterium BMS3Abin03]